MFLSWYLSARKKSAIKASNLNLDYNIEYVNRKTSWFIQKYNMNSKSILNSNLKCEDVSRRDSKLNSNIEDVFYDKKLFYAMLANGVNDIEKKWKTNVLCENTPRGNIFMYYDVYKHGFAYYSDQQTIPYCILNAVAMKYSIFFLCCDFFMDEATIIAANVESKTEYSDSNLSNSVTWMTPLAKIFFEDDAHSENDANETNRNNIKSILKDAPLAKFKNYKMMDTKTKTKSPPMIPLKNKFIYLGKIVNYPMFKTHPQPKLINNVKSMYSDLFSDSDSDAYSAPAPIENTSKISWINFKNKNKNKSSNV